MQQVAEHSPAQLRLLSDAAARIEASAGLMQTQAAYAGTAATVSREGGRVYEKLTKALAKQAQGT